MKTCFLSLWAAAGLLAAPALAQSTLYVVSPSGAIYSADSQIGNFTLQLTAPEALHSVVQTGNKFYLGAPSGNLYSFVPSTGSLSFIMALPNDVTDIVVHDADLLVSGSDGTVLRVNPRLGVIDETHTATFAIEALALDGDTLYVGTPLGLFEKLDLTNPEDFTFAGVCGGPINAMEITENELYLADSTGQVYVYDKATEFVSYAYPIPNDGVSFVRDGDEFLSGGSDGTIHRVTQIFGILVDTYTAPEAVGDMWIEEPEGLLVPDSDMISLSTGGAVQFSLSAAVQTAGDTYLLLGTASGTAPGVTVDGVHVALNPDVYTTLTLPPFGDEPLQGSFGVFDLAGAASASLVLPPGLDPILIGLTLHHAFVTFDSADPSALLGSSNSVAVQLLP